MQDSPGIASNARVNVTNEVCEQFTRWSLDWGAFLRAPIEAEKVAAAWERVRSGSVWNRPAWMLEVAGGPWAEFGVWGSGGVAGWMW